MGNGVMRLGDPNVAGGIILTGEFSVRANGRPVATIGATVTPHPPCPKIPTHCKASTTINQFTVKKMRKILFKSLIQYKILPEIYSSYMLIHREFFRST